MSHPNPVVTQEIAQVISEWVDSWIGSGLLNPVPSDMGDISRGILNLFMARPGLIPADCITIFKVLLQEAVDQGHFLYWLVYETDFETGAIKSGDRSKFANNALGELLKKRPELTDPLLDLYSARIKRVFPEFLGDLSL